LFSDIIIVKVIIVELERLKLKAEASSKFDVGPIRFLRLK